MKVLLFIILLAAAIAAYYRYVHTPGDQAGTPATVSSTAPAQPASGGQMMIERATGKTAVDQGMKVRQIIQKANTSNARMPNF